MTDAADDTRTETVTLSQDETKLVRTLLRVDTAHDPDAVLDGQQLTFSSDDAREFMGVLGKHMTMAMAGAHETDEYDGLHVQHENVQSVNQKLLAAFRGGE